LGHIVDGGYYENSGTTTALEILRAIRAAGPEIWNEITPVVIIISNDPKIDDLWNPGSERPITLGVELLSPLRTLMRTREARGAFSTNELGNFIFREQGGTYLSVRLLPQPVAPLGWTLSESARLGISLQLVQVLRTLLDEREQLQSGVNVRPANMPDCIRLNNAICSLDSSAEHRVLQFLLGSSDIRGDLRKGCEQMFRDVLDLAPASEREQLRKQIDGERVCKGMLGIRE
jgi:hypothetical protein